MHDRFHAAFCIHHADCAWVLKGGTEDSDYNEGHYGSGALPSQQRISISSTLGLLRRGAFYLLNVLLNVLSLCHVDRRMLFGRRDFHEQAKTQQLACLETAADEHQLMILMWLHSAVAIYHSSNLNGIFSSNFNAALKLIELTTFALDVWQARRSLVAKFSYLKA